MLKVEKLTFIRVNQIDGVNKDTKIPFSFANMVVSDGLESIELPLELSLVPQCKSFGKGDKLNLDLDLTKNGYNFKVNITRVTKIA